MIKWHWPNSDWASVAHLVRQPHQKTELISASLRAMTTLILLILPGMIEVAALTGMSMLIRHRFWQESCVQKQ